MKRVSWRVLITTLLILSRLTDAAASLKRGTVGHSITAVVGISGKGNGKMADDMAPWEFQAQCSLSSMDHAGRCPRPAVASVKFPHAVRHGEDLVIALVCRDCLVAHRRMAEQIPGPCPFCGEPLHKATEWMDDVRYLSATL